MNTSAMNHQTLHVTDARSRISRRALAVGIAALFASSSALAIDWSKVPTRNVILFHPGQASWEWVMTQADHSGASKFRAGKNCSGCHDGEQKEIGGKIAAGGKMEPGPRADKKGSVLLKVAAAHDADRLWLRLQWPVGTSSAAAAGKFAARATVMLDDGHVKEAARAGCWSSCHDDAIGMASAPKGKSITKYLAASRTKIARSGGGENFKSPGELAALLKQGIFLEYWQAALNPGKPAKAVSGYILDRRHEHKTPASAATATLKDGQWTVELSRPLKAAGAGQKTIGPGTRYSLGFAVHDNQTAHRQHWVSLEQTLVLDSGTADFVAKGQ